MKRTQRNAKLGQQIRFWRIDNRITALWLADALGVSRQRVWDWERHGVPDCDVVLVRLAIRQLHGDRLDIG